MYREAGFLGKQKSMIIKRPQMMLVERLKHLEIHTILIAMVLVAYHSTCLSRDVVLRFKRTLRRNNEATLLGF
jgi:hypothetical protein